MNQLYLIDSFGILFKAYYATMRKPLTNYRGESVSALLVFIKTVQQILRHAQEAQESQESQEAQESQEQGSPHVAVILDSGRTNFRHDMYAEYKANRDAAPEDLVVQIGYLKKLLELWGLPTFSIPGYEADDIIATLARLASEHKTDCYIITNDKDLYQLIDEHISILKLEKSSFQVQKADFAKAKWGVAPKQMRDYLAIIGDAADNIPGVRGIGPKGALKLLEEYQSLQNIYANLERINPESMRKKLQDSREQALLSYELVALADQIPEFTENPERPWAELWQQLQASQTTPPKRELAQFLAELGLNQLAKEFDPEIPDSQSQPSSSSPQEQQSLALSPPNYKAPEPQTPEHVLKSYECVRTEEQLEAWCARIAAAKYVAIDTETTGLNELKDKLLGISLCTAKNQACYIPLRSHGRGVPQKEMQEEVQGEAQEEEILSAGIVRKALAKCLQADVKIIGQNFKFDYKFLANWQLPIQGIYFDTMIAAWLLDSSHPVGMDALAKRYLNIEPIHFSDVLASSGTPKKNASFADVPLEQAVRYAAEDADITWQLYECFEPMLKEQKLDKLFYELEMPLVQILGDMELHGIRCSRKKLEDYAEELQIEIGKLEKTIYELAGGEFNLNSPQQLSKILFETLALSGGKKTKSGFSTDNSVLEGLTHPIIAPVLEYRHANKLYSTYVKSLPEMIVPQTQRIHTHFSVIGTETGRLNSKDPNLQNIPIKDAAGRRIREAFQPEPGWAFFSADYSQIELVVLAHLSHDRSLGEAFRSGHDIHKQTASQIFGIPLERVSNERRRIAKSINFGVIYGMSAFRLSRDLGLTRKEAKDFIEAYFREFSGVKSFIATTIATAKERGFVETLFGRRREIRQLRSNNKLECSHGERMAVNTVVQGSAADIVKQAMILLRKELQQRDWQSRLLLQVHDELIFEAPSAEKELLESLVLDTMENAYDLDVPLRVNGEWSNQSWGALH